MTSGRSSTEPWTLVRPERFHAWATAPTRQLGEPGEFTPREERELRERIAALEFVRDVIGTNPDFGEILDDNTRRMTVPGTSITLIWTFSPTERSFEVITPFEA